MFHHGDQTPAADPTVLVVMPTLGERLETLKQAMDSVAAQAGVTTRLVVVVPSAAEGAREVAAQYGASIIDDPRSGLAAAVNAGLSAHQGETFYAWLNDDDYLEPNALATLVALLEANPDASVSYGACRYVDDEGRTIGMSRAGDFASRILGWGPDLVPQPAALHRMDAVTRAGRYDESLRFAMDLDMLLRLRRLGRFVSTREHIANFRWHPDSLTVANRKFSLAESENVKHRYISPRVRRIAPLWDLPVRVATHVAARQVNRRARAVAANGTVR